MLNDSAHFELEQLRTFKNILTRFMMAYKFALDEMDTRVKILQQEFQYSHDYNPIEHTKSRLKSPESILKKLHRKGLSISLANIKQHIHDIAGLRITCSFISDIYQLSDMLQKQTDLRIIEIKDYIQKPKPNGYQSLHLLLEIPVFTSEGQTHVCVEVQIRTIAMDFWASLEHKIYYKYNQSVPERLLQELKEAAVSAAELDRKMEELHHEINDIKEEEGENAKESLKQLDLNNIQFRLPKALLKSLKNEYEQDKR